MVENKLTTLRANLQAANQAVEDLESGRLLLLQDANRDKEALEAKLIECKSKLEATVAKYDEKSD